MDRPGFGDNWGLAGRGEKSRQLRGRCTEVCEIPGAGRCDPGHCGDGTVRGEARENNQNIFPIFLAASAGLMVLRIAGEGGRSTAYLRLDCCI